MLLSHLESNYCDVIWDNCKQDKTNKLQTIQNRCARKILEKMPGASAGPLLKELGWLTLKEKRGLHKCVMLHGLLQGKGPQTLCAEVDKWRNRGITVTRGVTNHSLSLPTHNTNYITKSFFYDTAKLWNKIPLSIRQIKNRTTFKEKLHSHLINQR